ncbi:MAG: ATP synthase F1 subunit gamma [Bacteroidales bacterium]|nr:ATP synthase F1 subunit gamma [Bacteroidales bacterium]MDD4683627.1 ATP synthase F1 subunit gamma [Bacteroidales bacterium]
MANLKEVRNRIASVGSTMQITSAMKMVSASKLRRAQNAVVALRPYSKLLSNVISNIMEDNVELMESPYGRSAEIDNVLILVLTSNKGLCGGFNTNIIKEVKNRIKEISNQDKYIKVDVMSFGKKSSEHFSKLKGCDIIKMQDNIWDDLTFENVTKITEEVMELFVSEKYDKVEIIYNKFKNATTQIISREEFLPLGSLNDDQDQIINKYYIFEPSREEIIENIIPQALKIQMFRCMLDSFAAEHGARMTAMHKATDNAEVLLKDLKLSYNKARQAAITNEILEISSGAEALNG